MGIGKIKTIFADKWGKYREISKVRDIENINVLKMLSCRTALLGKHVYKCPGCGYEREVPHSCKSRFCSTCGYVATEEWIRKRFPVLLNCWYHHVVITVPSFFRWIIKLDRNLTLNLFARCAAETIQEWAKTKGYEVGVICFFHSFGANLQFHPHFHLLVTAGGLKPDGAWHYTDGKIPGHILVEKFKAKFVSGIRKLFAEGKLHTKGNLSRIYYQIKQIHNKHWQFYTERITKRGTATMRYCIRYAKKMILSEKRIIDYDGKEVTFFNSKKKVLVYKVMHFVKCVVQHIPEKYFKMIRYYGFYANKSKKKYALARKSWQPLKEKTDKVDWRTRQMYRDLKDPLKCPKCNTQLELRMVIYPEPIFKRTFDNIRLILGLAVQQNFKLDYG